MVVAVAGMRVMEVSGDEIVDVVSVRHGFMTAARGVHVPLLVSRAAVR